MTDRPVELDFLLAQLIDEPFQVQPDQIGRLTLRGIARLYFWPRNRDGRLLPPEDETPAANAQSIFRGVWADRGATPEQIDQLWEATQAHERRKWEQGVREGVVALTGEIFGRQRWAELETEYIETWRPIARRIMGHGE